MNLETMNRDGLIIVLSQTKKELAHQLTLIQTLENDKKQLEQEKTKLKKELDALDKVLDKFKGSISLRNEIIKNILKDLDSIRHKADVFKPSLEKNLMRADTLVKEPLPSQKEIEQSLLTPAKPEKRSLSTRLIDLKI